MCTSRVERLSRLIAILCLTFFASCSASSSFVDTNSSASARTERTIHVRPSGRPSDAQSDQAIWVTSIARAVSIARPGDTILLAPGVYKQRSLSSPHGLLIKRSGRQDAPITLKSEGGRGVIDCSEVKSRSVVYCLRLNADFWRIEDISVTGAKQNARGSWAVGVLVENSSFNELVAVQSFRNEGPGFLVTGKSRGNTLKDCWAHSNFDPKSTVVGGNADGIQIANIPKSATNNRIVNCRSINNSDDGFDLWRAEASVTILNSTAERNGYVPGSKRKAGDGVGFKLGPSFSGARHQIRNNTAIRNRTVGFDQNGSSANAVLVDNRSFGNGT